MTVVPLRPRPPAWAVLATALAQCRPVHACYHGRDRLLCPHVLGWGNGRAMVLCYQAAGSTSDRALPPDPRHRWRCMFVDELEHVVITNEPWQTAENYKGYSNSIDRIELRVE